MHVPSSEYLAYFRPLYNHAVDTPFWPAALNRARQVDSYPLPLVLLSMNPRILACPSKLAKKHRFTLLSHNTTSSSLA
jgi:hypothetical protein